MRLILTRARQEIQLTLGRESNKNRKKERKRKIRETKAVWGEASRFFETRFKLKWWLGWAAWWSRCCRSHLVARWCLPLSAESRESTLAQREAATTFSTPLPPFHPLLHLVRSMCAHVHWPLCLLARRARAQGKITRQRQQEKLLEKSSCYSIYSRHRINCAASRASQLVRGECANLRCCHFSLPYPCDAVVKGMVLRRSTCAHDAQGRMVYFSLYVHDAINDNVSQWQVRVTCS